MALKKALIDHLTESTKEFTVPTLRGNSKDIYSEIIETLEYQLSDEVDQSDAENQLDDCECPDLDTWAPYYAQRTEIVKALSSSEESDCEDYLEGIYEKPFDGCETFTDCEARIARAALELGHAEAKDDIRKEIEAFFESLPEAVEPDED